MLSLCCVNEEGKTRLTSLINLFHHSILIDYSISLHDLVFRMISEHAQMVSLIGNVAHDLKVSARETPFLSTLTRAFLLQPTVGRGSLYYYSIKTVTISASILYPLFPLYVHLISSLPLLLSLTDSVAIRWNRSRIIENKTSSCHRHPIKVVQSQHVIRGSSEELH